MKLTRKFVRPGFPYVLKQGLSNLFRPRNQTWVGVITLGLGAGLLITLSQVRGVLLAESTFSHNESEPNAALFDVQTQERQAFKNLLSSHGLPVLDQVPLVSMRLAALKGVPLAELRRRGLPQGEEWAFLREYRSTHRGQLIDSERLLAGEWVGQHSGPGPVPVSVEEDLAKTLGISLGDTVRFDVQGFPVDTIVASLRRVDWNRIHPNFFVVFPQGVLEKAPQYWAITTRVKSSAELAALQVELRESFPHVSSIDLRLILETLRTLLDKVAMAVRFLSSFSLATGLLVLAAALWVSRSQRIEESALLRTLGASHGQIRGILATEYFSLGLFGGLAGVLLALTGTWALAHFIFQVPFSIHLLSLTGIFAGVVGLATLAGAMTSRGVLNHPPLEVLRREG